MLIRARWYLLYLMYFGAYARKEKRTRHTHAHTNTSQWLHRSVTVFTAVLSPHCSLRCRSRAPAPINVNLILQHHHMCRTVVCVSPLNYIIEFICVYMLVWRGGCGRGVVVGIFTGLCICSVWVIYGNPPNNQCERTCVLRMPNEFFFWCLLVFQIANTAMTKGQEVDQYFDRFIWMSMAWNKLVCCGCDLYGKAYCPNTS